MPDHNARKSAVTLLAVRGLSPELLDDLETLFPERCPEMDSADRDIWFYAGKRALVRDLRQALQQQQRQANGGRHNAPIPLAQLQ